MKFTIFDRNTYLPVIIMFMCLGILGYAVLSESVIITAVSALGLGVSAEYCRRHTYVTYQEYLRARREDKDLLMWVSQEIDEPKALPGSRTLVTVGAIEERAPLLLDTLRNQGFSINTEEPYSSTIKVSNRRTTAYIKLSPACPPVLHIA